MKITIIIPARYQSSRFPGKPLALIKGKPMIRWVADVCKSTGFETCVATDDQRIIDEVLKNQIGVRVYKTKDTHLTGTDRCAEVNEKIGADIVINVQGDEPLVSRESILDVIEAAVDTEQVVNATTGCSTEEEYRSRNTIKMVSTNTGNLLYASRSPIPGAKAGQPVAMFKKQVCIYAIPKAKLARFAWCGMKGKTYLESQEDIEILRFLELGIPVHTVPVEKGSIAVDVPEDIAKVEAEMDRREKRE